MKISKDYFLLLIVLFVLISNIIWLNLDGRYFHGEMLGTSGHLVTTSEFYRILRYDMGDFFRGFIHLEKIYPPVPYIAGALMMLFHPVPDMAAFANTIFLIGSIICTFFIAKALFDFEIAILASAFLGFYPLAYSFSRIVGVDVALMFFVTMSILLLIHSKGMEKRGISILLGVISGLGMLVKWAFPFFLAGPAIYFLILASSDEKGKLIKRLVNLLIIALIAAAISFPWYYVNYDSIKEFARFQSALAVKTSALKLLFSKYFFFMLIRLPNMITLPQSILFFIGVTAIISKGDKKAWFPMIWYATPYTIFAAFYARTDRYFLPALPALAIISLYGIKVFSAWLYGCIKKQKEVSESKSKKILLYSSLPFIIFGYTSLLVFSFPGLGDEGFLGRNLYEANFPEFSLYNLLAAEPHPPYQYMAQKGTENTSDVEKLIENIKTKGQIEDKLHLLLMPYNGYISGDLSRYMLNVKNIPWEIPKELHYEIWGEDYFRLILGSEVIILNPTSQMYMNWLKNNRSDYFKYLIQGITLIVKDTPIFNSHFNLQESFLLENDTVSSLFFRRTKRTPAEDFDIIIEALKKEKTNRTAIKDIGELEADKHKVEEALIEVERLLEYETQNEKLNKLKLYLSKLKEVR